MGTSIRFRSLTATSEILLMLLKFALMLLYQVSREKARKG